VSIAVITAVADPRWEADISAGLSRGEGGITVVRRCVDLGDLLAASAAGLARAVILSADLRRLDHDAVDRLYGAQVAVIGVVGAEGDEAALRLRSLGVRHLLPNDASSRQVSDAVIAAVAEVADSAALAGERTADADPPAPATAIRRPAGTGPAAVAGATSGTGRIVAVWGPAGSPGRSTIAVNLAAELAELGRTTLLVDADSYGGAVGQLLGVLDEAPGVAAACRLANHGRLDRAALAGVAVQLRPGLRVLTGVTRPERWIELRPAALRIVLDIARSLAEFVVVDCGFCLEQDEEMVYDTVAPRRNGATVTALEVADQVIGVTAADPVGLARYVRALPECTALASGRPALTVVNRLRRAVVGPGEPRQEIASALERFAGVSDIHAVPQDCDGLDAALATGRVLAECAPAGPARQAIEALAARLAGVTLASRRMGRGSRRRSPLSWL
jgi:Flp pilus assembly CpaE family ATPase